MSDAFAWCRTSKRNRATIGEHQPRSYIGGSKKGTPIGNPISAYYPAVIDEATFQAAQEARRRNLLTGRGRKGNNIANLFTGLTTCLYCGRSVKFYRNGPDKSLICEQVLDGVVRRDNPKGFLRSNSGVDQAMWACLSNKTLVREL